MITVADARQPVMDVLGTCDEETFYAKINELVSELKNTGLWDPLIGKMDICTDRDVITLPDDVEAPLAINVGGAPANFKNKWFEYHLNGPGSDCCASCCDSSWVDEGTFPTFRSIIQPATLQAFADQSESAGAVITVYGYKKDSNGQDQWVMTPDVDGNLQDGEEIAIDYPSGAAGTVLFSRITRVRKPVTNGFIRLVANDPGSSDGTTLLGYYRPYITEPTFRRVKISGAGCNRWRINGGSNSGCCATNGGCTNATDTWVRMSYRKKIYQITSMTDLIPLNSMTAIKMMAMAIKKYENDLLDEYEKYFESAKDALRREQKAQNGPNQIKIQFIRPYGGGRTSNMV